MRRGPAGNLKALQDGEVHVWIADVSDQRAQFDELKQVICDEERARAERFVRSVDQQRYTVSHGILRCLLGQYISAPPESLRLVAGDFGKPELAEKRFVGLEFNMAHSENLVAYVLADRVRVGVDIEHVREGVDIHGIMSSHFSAAEIAHLTSLAESERRLAFYRCWTRKEAFLKALGTGLSFPLDKFSVTLSPRAAARLSWVENDPSAPDRWKLYPLEMASDYCGAVAVEGERSIRMFNWRGGMR